MNDRMPAEAGQPTFSIPVDRRNRPGSSEPPLFISTSSRDGELTSLLNNIFLEAAKKGASDIHVEDEWKDCRIRCRIHGKMEEWLRVPRSYGMDINTKVRMRARLSLQDVKKPQDGRFSLNYESENGGEGLALDIRVSIQPTIYGHSLVCRILDQKNTSRRIDEIHMAPAVLEWIKILVREPHGLFLITGPTGSGKTTTLYALLNELNDGTTKIVTIEDPVEYRVPGLSQTNIEGDMTFAKALREALRQDPDTILVGEIRDAETASIAVQAAMTGHLVLSTLHTNDACQTAVRMMDLGVDPNTLGTALRGVLAQRLVRRLDPEHREMCLPNEFEQRWLVNNAAGSVDVPYGTTNKECGVLAGEGYAGRLPVMELVVIDRLVRNVLPLKDAKLIRSVAKGQPQYRTLAQAGADLAAAGHTSLAEVFAITSMAEVANGARSLGERLIELGRITPYQLKIAKEIIAEASSKGEVLTLEETLIRQRYCSREDIDEAETL